MKSPKKEAQKQNTMIVPSILEQSPSVTIADGILLACIMVLIALLSYTDYEKQRAEGELFLINHLGVTYHTGTENIIIRFNISEPNSLQMVREIERICKLNNISTCMSTVDRLNIKGPLQ